MNAQHHCIAQKAGHLRDVCVGISYLHNAVLEHRKLFSSSLCEEE